MSKRIRSSNQTNAATLPNLQPSKRIHLSDNNSSDGVDLLGDNIAPSSDFMPPSLPLPEPQVSLVNVGPSSIETLDSADLPPMTANESEPLRCMECRTLLMDPSMSFLLKNFNFPVCDSCRWFIFTHSVQFL